MPPDLVSLALVFVYILILVCLGILGYALEALKARRQKARAGREE